ncbi:MAG: Glycosidase ph1107-related protein [Parcubacteria group bacterium Gr01-1014_70]|nr:MAG: Glycosidase ph1107-related protein [Parcubacteria group bacterium Gr01-1014_70]
MKRNKDWFTTFSGWTKTVIHLAAKLFSDPSVTVQRARSRKSARKKKAPRVMKREGFALEKVPENPLIGPNSDNAWEAWQTFNPGAILLGNDVHFLYRAVGRDGISRLGYAVSHDGLTIDERLTFPVYEHAPNGNVFTVYSYSSGGSWGGVEDPRLVRIEGEDVLYMTYTACCNDGLRVGLTSISVDDFVNHRWNWKAPVLISPPGEVHKNWVLFPEKISGKYAILHSINPAISIAKMDQIPPDDARYVTSAFGGNAPKRIGWDKWIRGAGPAPLKTPHGWLLLYHAMDNDRSKYRVGAMLLDLHNPAKILRRSLAPILEPTESYEYNGFKGGVVYASSALIKDDTLFVYYGGADSYVCAATADLEEFTSALLKDKTPSMKRRTVKRKNNP